MGERGRPWETRLRQVQRVDEEAAAKIAQTDAAMLQPLLEHTNAYLTGTLNKPAIDIDELNSLFCSTTGTGTRSTTVPRRRAN